jgi:hypothetical protein
MALSGKLASLKERAEKAKGFSGDGESPFFSLKGGESAKIRFLQELDEDSPLYDERRGAFEVIDEHAHPKDFKKTAVCTAESEGRCWACEQTSNPDIGKKWKAKLRLYANVLVRNPEGEDKVKILKRGFSDKDVGKYLVEFIEEFEALGGFDLKISRTGSGMNDTSWSVIPLAAKKMTADDEKAELIPLDKFIKRIPYDEQAAYFNGTDDGDGGSSEAWISE